MYSPLDNLQRMWRTPNYIIFKAILKQKEYYGRFKTIIVEPFDKVASGRFEAYDSLSASQSGSAGEEIVVTPEEIIGLEAFDIKSLKSPTPLFKILQTCKQIYKMQLISEDSPILIDKLMEAIEEFNEEHLNSEQEANRAIASLNYIKIEFANEEFSEENAIKMKEKISYSVQYFFQLLEDERL